jgi:hypothetical protein
VRYRRVPRRGFGGQIAGSRRRLCAPFYAASLSQAAGAAGATNQFQPGVRPRISHTASGGGVSYTTVVLVWLQPVGAVSLWSVVEHRAGLSSASASISTMKANLHFSNNSGSVMSIGTQQGFVFGELIISRLRFVTSWGTSFRQCRVRCYNNYKVRYTGGYFCTAFFRTRSR